MRSLLAVLVLLCGCTRTLDVEPIWVAGDLHVHSSVGSNDTDGDSSVSAIATVARDRGLGFVVLTDHSNATGSMECADVEDCPNAGPEFPTAAEAAASSGDGFVMVAGNEISPIWAGHVGGLPPDGGFAWDGAFVDRPEGEVTGADALAACRTAGGWPVLNHPFAQAPWIAWDWTSTDYAAMEVWNGGWRWDAGDARALAAWECNVARGQAVTPIAASDNHRVLIDPPGDVLDPPLGQPRTSVGLLPDVEPTWEAIRRALVAGRVVLHEEDTWLEATSLTWTPGAERWTIEGIAPVPARVELRGLPDLLGGEEGCDPADAESLHEVLWSSDVDGAFGLETGSIEHERDTSRLRYLALMPEPPLEDGGGGVALTGLLEVPPG